MMLSPFTLTSRSPAEGGGKTVTPSVPEVGTPGCPLTAGTGHIQGSSQGQNLVPSDKGSRGDPSAAQGIPTQGWQQGVARKRENEEMQEKDRNEPKKPWQAGQSFVPIPPAALTLPGSVPPLQPRRAPLTGAQPGLVRRPVLPHVLHEDGVHGLQAAPGGTCSQGTEAQGDIGGTDRSSPPRGARQAPRTPSTPPAPPGFCTLSPSPSLLCLAEPTPALRNTGETPLGGPEFPVPPEQPQLLLGTTAAAVTSPPHRACGWGWCWQAGEGRWGPGADAGC